MEADVCIYYKMEEFIMFIQIHDSELNRIVGGLQNPDIGKDDMIKTAGPFVLLIETGNPKEGFIYEENDPKPGAIRLLPA